ncbi:MAG TPA: helix-turn-helix domain-containing protein, partial [Gammaproteobacteria bacterium]
RILSATHKNLAEQVQQGHFREDLFYRINVIELHIPPLRERPEDIPPLVEKILASQAQTIGISRPRLSDAALATLSAYPFPGNVRELENILERAITLSEEEVIYAEDLHLATTARQQDEEVNAEEGVLQVGLEAYLEGLERKLIQQALQKTRHNKTAAAKRLGISFRALRYRLKKLGLE